METHRENKIRFARLLREAGFRATFGRIALLQALERANKPLTVMELVHGLKKHLDQATAYRALEALEAKGLVRRIDLGQAHSYFEIALLDHHHHLVCMSCDTIEDFAGCSAENMEKLALKGSSKFASLKEHSLEFFGICNACAV
jgi:Fur family transcriptional regulator, stress-responsive regulator